MPTLEELDEALAHAKRVPIEERGPAWWAFVDGLLEQRKALAHADERIEQIKAERAAVGRA